MRIHRRAPFAPDNSRRRAILLSVGAGIHGPNCEKLRMLSSDPLRWGGYHRNPCGREYRRELFRFRADCAIPVSVHAAFLMSCGQFRALRWAGIFLKSARTLSQRAGNCDPATCVPLGCPSCADDLHNATRGAKSTTCTTSPAPLAISRRDEVVVLWSRRKPHATLPCLVD